MPVFVYIAYIPYMLLRCQEGLLCVPLSQNLYLEFFLWPLQKCLCDQGFWFGFGFHKESEQRYNQTESDEEAKNVEESWTALKQMVYSTASETLGTDACKTTSTKIGLTRSIMKYGL